MTGNIIGRVTKQNSTYKTVMFAYSVKLNVWRANISIVF